MTALAFEMGIDKPDFRNIIHTGHYERTNRRRTTSETGSFYSLFSSCTVTNLSLSKKPSKMKLLLLILRRNFRFLVERRKNASSRSIPAVDKCEMKLHIPEPDILTVYSNKFQGKIFLGIDADKFSGFTHDHGISVKLNERKVYDPEKAKLVAQYMKGIGDEPKFTKPNAYGEVIEINGQEEYTMLDPGCIRKDTTEKSQEESAVVDTPNSPMRKPREGAHGLDVANTKYKATCLIELSGKVALYVLWLISAQDKNTVPRDLGSHEMVKHPPDKFNEKHKDSHFSQFDPGGRNVDLEPTGTKERMQEILRTINGGRGSSGMDLNLAADKRESRDQFGHSRKLNRAQVSQVQSDS